MAIEGRTHKPVIDYEKCSACSVCIEACPAEIIPDMRTETDSLRGTIYSDVDTDIRINISKEFVSPPCQVACPIDQDVRGYMRLIAEKHHKEALNLIRKTNPLPSVCGYVCHHPCELACIRSQVDEALSIKSLKRFAADYDNGEIEPTKTEKTQGKKIIIIGSGPAGLTAAHELVKKGYIVEIIESYQEPGGMLAWAIPNFRLPKEILKRDIEYIRKMGVTIKTGISLGLDATISDIKKDGADAIILATGTQKSLKMRIENEGNFKGFTDCLSLLKGYAHHDDIHLGNDVLIIGGGNAAIDTARSAIRLGAEKVTILYRRGRNEMPADRDEVDEALAENVALKFLTSPKRIIAENGIVKRLQCVKTRLIYDADSDRPRPVNIDGSEFIINASTIISAVGQEPDFSWMEKDSSLEITRQNTLAVNDKTMMTDMKGVFAAGDNINGPTTVVEAMASGKKVAKSVDHYLSEERE
ncbi:MAG: FAD-dependent oxidoreductase [Thermodesulfobacteriota bacterium]|nr:FAD-dependent oxidoreductase [Thermodesulfobacteriota bacterium]